VIGPTARVPRGQRFQVSNHLVHIIADGQIAADHVRIGVGEDRRAILEQAGDVEIEEDRAAAQERLEIAAEDARIEASQLWQ
jgi:hypothetical protein